jgi:hypothetical protein
MVRIILDLLDLREVSEGWLRCSRRASMPRLHPTLMLVALLAGAFARARATRQPTGGAAHPCSLLTGLNMGPNLAVTPSLSALIWWSAARSVSARPSVLRYSTAVGGLPCSPHARRCPCGSRVKSDARSARNRNRQMGASCSPVRFLSDRLPAPRKPILAPCTRTARVTC